MLEPKPKMTQTSMRLPQELLDRIDAYVASAQKGAGKLAHVDRSMALRHLLERGLEAEGERRGTRTE